jgi:hypothetical protein
VISPEALYSFRALWRQYRACRRNKRNTRNQLAFEIDVEANLFRLQEGPATHIIVGAARQFEVAGLKRAHWSSAAPIRAIFREAFQAAGLPYFNPHSLRNTLARLGEVLCQTPEEFKAWSQNLGHEGVLTTFLQLRGGREPEAGRDHREPRPAKGARAVERQRDCGGGHAQAESFRPRRVGEVTGGANAVAGPDESR